MNRGQTTLAALLLGCALLAAPRAHAEDLPPPEVRRSVHRQAPAPAALPSVTARPATDRTPERALPYRAPYVPRRAASAVAVLPVSGPRRVASRATRTYVPPAPGISCPRPAARPAPSSAPAAPAPRRAAPAVALAPASSRVLAALPPPTVARALPRTAPALAPSASRRVVAAPWARPRAAAADPHARTAVRRPTPRRPAPRCAELTVPPAPGHVQLQTGVRRTLPLVPPPGCSADG